LEISEDGDQGSGVGVSWQVFQRLEKCSTFQHGDPSKTEPFDRRGADFPILGRFRLAEPQSVPDLGRNFSDGWKFGRAEAV
jgi:hypothetical protein